MNDDSPGTPPANTPPANTPPIDASPTTTSPTATSRSAATPPTTASSPTAATAAFVFDGERLRPTPHTEGSWNPGTLLGRYLAGLVAWGAERHAEHDLQPARLTVDMFRPATMGSTELRTRVARDGRRIRVVDVDVIVDDVLVCRGSTVFLRRSAPPRGVGWVPEARPLPDPGTLEPLTTERWRPPWDQRAHGEWGQDAATRGCWITERHPFVAGHDTSPFVRAALAADNGNGTLNGTAIGLPYINGDLTMTMARLPVGEWIGLTPTSRAAFDGVSVGTLDLYDLTGRFAQVSMIALADERNLA